MQGSFILILTLTFLVALIYSSVGHGGASGYLALLSFFAFPHEFMATSALLLNLFVSAAAFAHFWKARHFSWNSTWPFILSSVPLAFLGGLIKLSPSVYSLLLGLVLWVAAFRLLVQPESIPAHQIFPSRGAALAIGGSIGLVSGMVGIGGGIFLTPLLVLFRWASPREAAATSALFILVNSSAGLLGRMMRHPLEISFSAFLIGLILAALLGGMIGSRLGANHFSAQRLKQILALVLLTASFKLFGSLH